MRPNNIVKIITLILVLFVFNSIVDTMGSSVCSLNDTNMGAMSTLFSCGMDTGNVIVMEDAKTIIREQEAMREQDLNKIAEDEKKKAKTDDVPINVETNTTLDYSILDVDEDLMLDWDI